MELSPQHVTARTPGTLGGKAPKQYGTGRRCRCGASISTYTKGEWCNPCLGDADRRAHFTRAPKGHDMPKTMKASAAAKALGITGQELKRFEHQGRIEPHTRGRGVFGHTYLESEVERFKAELERESEVEKVGRDAELDRNGDALDKALGGPVQRLVREHEECGTDEEVEGVGPAFDAPRHEHTPDCIQPTGPNSGLLLCSVPCEGAPCDCPPTECPRTDGTCCQATVVREHVSAEPGYPDPRDYSPDDEGAAQYEQAVKDFEGDTRLEPVDEPVQCCGQADECGTGGCVYAEGPEDAATQCPDIGDLLDQAWGVIANANLEDWNNDATDKSEWRVAAERFRDGYHDFLDWSSAEATEGEPEAPSEDRRDLLERAVNAAERATMIAAMHSTLTTKATNLAARAVERVVNLDREAVAIDGVVKALDGLDRAAVIRVLRWTTERFEVNRPLPPEDAQPASDGT